MARNGMNTTRKKLRNILPAIVLAFALYGCESKVFYSDFREVPAEGWQREVPMSFVLPDSAGMATADLTLNLRHDNNYPYRNLWLVVDYVGDNRVLDSDTVNMELCDKFGNWHGSGIGKLFQFSKTLKQSLPVGKVQKVVLWQDMRVDTLIHIEDVGVSLSPSTSH